MMIAIRSFFTALVLLLALPLGTGWWGLPVSFALSLAWTVASAFAYGSVPSLVRWRAGPFAGGYAYRAMSYGSTILLLLLVPVMLLVGVAVAQVCAVRG